MSPAIRWSGFVFALLIATSLVAADWPQWRGPNRDDVSQETGLQTQWAADGPSRLWLSKDAGIGYSGFSVVGDTLYTMGAKDDEEHLIAVNVADGQTKWSAAIAPLLTNRWGTARLHPHRRWRPGLCPVRPRDARLRQPGRRQRDLEGRDEGFRWRRTGLGLLRKRADRRRKTALHARRQAGSDFVLDKLSGQKIWQSKDFTDGAQYASIIAADHGGKRQYIQLTQKNFVGVDATNGDVLWTTTFDGKTAVVPTPIFHYGCVYVASGYGAGCKMIRLSASNEVEEVYVNKNMTNHHGGVVLVGDHLYGYSDGKGWVCQNFKTGEMVWNEKNKLGKGSLTCAGGKLYCYDERKGEVALIDASPTGWQEHGRFKIDPQTTQRSSSGGIWTHPVVADGKLFLRDQELLACYDIGAK